MTPALLLAACSLPANAGSDAATQTAAFSKRSVEVVAIAAAGDAKRLQSLVKPDAPFTLGRGDVGQPFGAGPEGAIKMAAAIKAATYAYPGWDYIPVERDACGDQMVEVQFLNADGSQSTMIKFVYQDGLVKSATGWTRTRNAGSVVVEAPRG